MFRCSIQAKGLAQCKNKIIKMTNIVSSIVTTPLFPLGIASLESRCAVPPVSSRWQNLYRWALSWLKTAVYASHVCITLLPLRGSPTPGNNPTDTAMADIEGAIEHYCSIFQGRRGNHQRLQIAVCLYPSLRRLRSKLAGPRGIGLSFTGENTLTVERGKICVKICTVLIERVLFQVRTSSLLSREYGMSTVCSPFSLSLSPRVFARCTEATIVPLRQQGFCLAMYLDDWLLLAV